MTTSPLKVYGMKKTPNTDKIEITAKYTGISVDVENIEFGVTNKSSEFLSKFPFGKIPAMDTPQGPIYESNAICYYLATQKEGFLGANLYEEAQTQQYINSLTCELFPPAAKVIYCLLGYYSYVADEFNKSHSEMMSKLKVYDEILKSKTWFVGERLTLVDVLFACSLHRVFTLCLDAKKRSNLVNLTRWFVTVINQENFKQVLGQVELCKTPADPSKVVKKAAPAPKAAAADKPKEKSALELMGPAKKMNLEEWKRVYSNCDDDKLRSEGAKWFWEHYDPTEYSIWRATYKYNNELKKIFMSCNLVGGLFARMEMMRKYCFASVCIFGEDDKNEISGVFVIRGTEMPELMKDVADYEVYEWSKMDTSDAVQRELFEDYLEWNGKFEGKSFNQGKIFK